MKHRGSALSIRLSFDWKEWEGWVYPWKKNPSLSTLREREKLKVNPLLYQGVSLPQNSILTLLLWPCDNTSARRKGRLLFLEAYHHLRYTMPNTQARITRFSYPSDGSLIQEFTSLLHPHSAPDGDDRSIAKVERERLKTMLFWSALGNLKRRSRLDSYVPTHIQVQMYEDWSRCIVLEREGKLGPRGQASANTCWRCFRLV